MCRVFIADDVPAMRSLWRLFLEEDPGIAVVGEAGDGDAALAGVEETRPDVLLLDLSMPERDGLEVIPVVRTASPETAIVVASGFTAARMAPQALELGAAAYFEKGGSSDVLRRIVRDACA
ncbi:MAG: response regulator transcription factor [Solirubrobacteraceae bacterium]